MLQVVSDRCYDLPLTLHAQQKKKIRREDKDEKSFKNNKKIVKLTCPQGHNITEITILTRRLLLTIFPRWLTSEKKVTGHIGQ